MAKFLSVFFHRPVEGFEPLHFGNWATTCKLLNLKTFITNAYLQFMPSLGI